MRLLSKMFLFLAFCPFALLEAQSIPSSFSGEWELNADQRFRFENGNVMLLEKNSKGNFEIFNKDKPYQLQQSSIINRNNAQYTWVNTCKECGWTETQTYLFAYINKYVMRVRKIRMVNNIGGLTDSYQSWHSSDAKSFVNTSEGDLYPIAIKRVEKPVVGAAAHVSLTIQKVSLHANFTAVTFKLKSNLSYTADYELNKPGSEKAFMIQDMRGRTFKLIDEFGYGGFGKLSLEGYGSREFTCYFEPIPVDTQMVNIKEGNCSGTNCWNFYDVNLK